MESMRALRRALVLLALLPLVIAMDCNPPSDPGPTPTPTVTVVRHVATTGRDSGNNCLVSTDPCATIQYAQNIAIPNELVQVAQGTYAESVTINRRIILRGSGKGVTVIRGGIVVGPMTVFTGSIAIEIENLSVRPGGNLLNGISITTGGLEHAVRQVDIQGFADNGLNVIGTVASGGANVTISASEMSLNQGDGIHIESPGIMVLGDIEVTGNTGDGLAFNGFSVFSNVSGLRVKARSNGEAGIQVEGMANGSVTFRDSCALSNGSQAGFYMSAITGGQILVERTNLAYNASGGAAIFQSAISPDPDLRNNWWGSSSGPSGAGPGVGDIVSAGIRYSPFSATAFVVGTPSCQ